MHIEVRCFATLAVHAPPDKRLALPEGATAGEAMRVLNIRPEDLKLIFVNGVHAEPDRILNDGDRVAFVPAVGGG